MVVFEHVAQRVDGIKQVQAGAALCQGIAGWVVEHQLQALGVFLGQQGDALVLAQVHRGGPACACGHMGQQCGVFDVDVRLQRPMPLDKQPLCLGEIAAYDLQQVLGEQGFDVRVLRFEMAAHGRASWGGVAGSVLALALALADSLPPRAFQRVMRFCCSARRRPISVCCVACTVPVCAPRRVPHCARSARVSATSRKAVCTVFSYCAKAMRWLACATSTPARRRPPSKMGSLICGIKLQVPLPLENSASSSRLAEPTLPVRVMLGNSAARAAPMLACIARSWCSAACTSGRCSNTLEGRAGGPGSKARLWAVSSTSVSALGSRSGGRLLPSSSCRALRLRATCAV